MVEVTGSSPVLPIRENKNECGKEMRMSVCLTQPISRAVHSDSQHNFWTLLLTKAGSVSIIYSEPRG